MTRSHRALQTGALAAPIVALAIAGWANRWIFDDGFIYLRVVRQLRAGNGPVFNEGERVEAFTSPLWVAILAVADLATPVRLEWIAVGLGIALSLLGITFALIAASRLVGRDREGKCLVPLGIFVFAAVLPTWYFESSGLETGLVFAWLGACLWALARWADSGDEPLSSWAAALLGLGWLVRPELVLDSVVFFFALVPAHRRAGGRRVLRLAAVMVALPVAYQIFRMGYYGSAIANTAIAKEGSALRVDAGWSYLIDFVAPYRLWIPLAALGVGIYAPLVATLRRQGATRALLVLVTFPAAGLANAAGVVAFGGDYLHGRLLLPALFALSAPVAVVPVAKRYVAGTAVAVWALISATVWRPPQLDTPNGIFIRGDVAFVVPLHTVGRVDHGVDPKLVARLRQRALFVVDNTAGFGSRYVRPDVSTAPDLRLPTVVTGGIGALGYALGPGVAIIDLNGLAEPIAGHFELARRGQTGHEKVLTPAWIAALVTASDSAPRADDFKVRTVESTPPAVGLTFSEEVGWARRALDCPGIADLRQSVRRDLTPRRFFSNIWHSLTRAQRRVPSDPQAAYRKFCDDG